MRRALALALLLGVSGCGGTQLGGGRAVDEIFPDAALAACVVQVTGVPSAGSLVTPQTLADVTSLTCDGGRSADRIRSLAGIDRLTGLTSLDASRNEITDLSPLAGEDGLAELDLSDNTITDVSPLAGLPTPDTVRLSRNAVVDPAPLLQELQLGANPVTDLTPLVGIGSLVDLGLDETDGSRLTGIDGLRAAGVSVNGLA